MKTQFIIEIFSCKSKRIFLKISNLIASSQNAQNCALAIIIYKNTQGFQGSRKFSNPSEGFSPKAPEFYFILAKFSRKIEKTFKNLRKMHKFH